MNKTFYLFFFIIILPLVYADMGPKPTMNFHFIYDTGINTKIIDGLHFACNSPDCSDAKLFCGGEDCEQQWNETTHAYYAFDCKEWDDKNRLMLMTDKCMTMSLGFPEYSKLIVTFEDKKRESNIFRYDEYNPVYNVYVHENDLTVEKISEMEKTTNIFKNFFDINFFLALILTILIELLVAYVYLKKAGKSLYGLRHVLIINIITLPSLWVIVYNLPFLLLLISPIIVLLLEVIILLVESVFIYYFNRKELSYKDGIIISSAANIASFFIGGMIFLILRVIISIMFNI